MSRDQRHSGLAGVDTRSSTPLCDRVAAAGNSFSRFVLRYARTFRLYSKNLRANQFARLGRDIAALSPADFQQVVNATFEELLKVKGRGPASDPQRLLVTTASGVARKLRANSPAANHQTEEREARLLRPEHRIADLVQRLPDERRQILLLHVRGGFDYQEIGRLLGLRPGHVLRELVKTYSALSRDDFACRLLHGGATTTSPSN